ncbi:MAG: leucine-rich repeat domain-containing protein [Promethearchaeota archaeon]
MDPEIVEYRVNQFITLRLENGKTNLYIDDELFVQCIRLVLNIPIEDVVDARTIDSIDDASEKYGTVLEGKGLENKIQEIRIPPDEEFWGHCSNLQAWYENGYDTRLLHSNLAFPLLKKLGESGDKAAINALNAELTQRLESGHLSVFGAVLQAGLLKNLSDEQLDRVIKRLEIPIKYLNYLTSITANFLKMETDNTLKKRKPFRSFLVKLVIMRLKQYIEEDNYRYYFDFYNDDCILLESLGKDDWTEILNNFNFLTFLDYLKRIDDNNDHDNSGKYIMRIGNHFINEIRKAVEENDESLLELIGECNIVRWMHPKDIREVFSPCKDFIGALRYFDILYCPDGFHEYYPIPRNLMLGIILAHSKDFGRMFQEHNNEYIIDLQLGDYFESLDGEVMAAIIEGCEVLDDEKKILKEISTQIDDIFDFDVQDGHVILLGFRGYDGKPLSDCINMNHNISTIPDSIKYFKHLKSLHIPCNSFNAFPHVVTTLTQLEVLNVSYNNFHELPQAITNLNNLKILNIKSNWMDSGDLTENQRKWIKENEIVVIN